jgi:hypothetical protein
MPLRSSCGLHHGKADARFGHPCDDFRGGIRAFLTFRPERIRDPLVRTFNQRRPWHRSHFGGITRVWFPLEAETYLRRLQSDRYIIYLRLFGVYLLIFALFVLYKLWSVN